ncbi:hypothetical protein M8998_14080 [Sphingobacterium sp. lm-10]|uniref:hypothetical protein n=1 Tax=Sphingobacterium sp. lm-10 TaxID=2944904 RepID=UPI002020A745|nr:hypothetical protein [Sphingobacterium sp. lm-10]MCL7989073.1 hypothetical protein [Sphingobacterium sp. lm-10]
MKTRTVYFFLCIVFMCFAACSKNDFEYQGDFEKSLQTWQRFKQENNNSYRYTVNGISWTGMRWETTLTIENGIITKRDFHYGQYHYVSMPTSGWTIKEALEITEELNTENGLSFLKAEEILSELSWVEGKNEIGLHKQTPAAMPITLDEVYNLAANQWLLKRKDASISFEVKNNGLISSAGYVPHNCADDCFFGITISAIDPLKN